MPAFDSEFFSLLSIQAPTRISMPDPHQFGNSIVLRSIVIFTLFLAIQTSFAQQSSLTVNAINVDQEPAEGFFILKDNALQDSTWHFPLSEGTVYFPLFSTVGIIETYTNPEIKIYPNPIGRSHDVKILIDKSFRLKTIKVFNATGKEVYKGKVPIDNFTIQSSKGMIVLLFQNEDGFLITRKLISIVEGLSFQIEGLDKGGSLKSAYANAYTLTFEDVQPEDPEYSVLEEQVEVEDGEHRVLYKTLEYAPKNIIIQGVTSPDANGLVKTEDETIGSLPVDSDGLINHTFQYPFSKNRTLPIVIRLTDDYAEDVSISEDAKHNQVISLNQLLTYNYNLSGTLSFNVG